ncbi:YihY/virulence factor BrkB family protein [Hahella aquimaris]|uniref:YihY/virulence factor BrkB family protein n=1 Tax=Hahella sp. HNIBRBA332 TaxID=3015983 RepID=UPI00273B31E3|nr:YihY/virulence factor BrkB family protein [Hahella sp. HNIBRBA332]WLQ11745.1 YihY/virulence factor BrkB family protein [Hahella sp. HNIBRBA332]
MSKATIETWVSRLDRWLWENETGGAAGGFMRVLWHSARVLFAVVRDVLFGHVTLHAMGLVYTTLLSIVPLLALSFSVLKGFGVHNQLEPLLENVFQAFGEKGPELVQNVLAFVDNVKVGVLGSVGLGLLIYTVISLVQKVERSFNEIWRVSQIRSLAQRFSSYLSVIVIGPLLAFSAMGATATLVGTDVAQTVLSIEPFGRLFALATRMAPYVIIVALFTFMYRFIPNTKVRTRYAFIGGLGAGIAWQTTGYVFAKFVVGTSNYEAIYSGFAVGILVLIWLYISWLILLMGASVAFYAQHSHQITRQRRVHPCAVIDERTGLALVYKVAKKFDQQGGGESISDLEDTLSVGPDTIQRIIDKLLKKGVLAIMGDEADSLIPARPLDRITLAELMHVLRSPEHSLPASLYSDKSVDAIAKGVTAAMEASLGQMTLASWVRGEEPLVREATPPERAAS